MAITTLSSREFNQGASRAKKASLRGPVFITDRGKPAHVLLSIDEYQRISATRRNVVEALSMPGLSDIDLDPPRSRRLVRRRRPRMTFLLDTNVLSELRKAGDGKADPNVVAWLASVDASILYLSAITLMELEVGILRMERRDRTQGTRLRTWMDQHVLPEFMERTLPIDAAVAMRCAALHVPDPRPERDALIAATALVNGMTLVTRNVDDFRGCGAPVLNPWTPHKSSRKRGE